MRSQTSLEATTPVARTTDDKSVRYTESTNMMHDIYRRMGYQPSQMSEARIPRHEQDEDRWRFERPIPGRDPVTEERGMGA